ncbi:MAG: hypothetical protein ACTHMB_16120, partial [Candidatus Binatia bacterium]
GPQADSALGYPAKKSSSVGCVSYVDKGALKLFELIKKSDLEGLVVKRKDRGNMQRRLFGINSSWSASRHLI